MIACNGNKMERGLLEIWDIIVEQNVATVVSFNNKITPEVYDEAKECYRYFPGDSPDDCSMEVDDAYVIKHDFSKMIKTSSSTTRFLEVFEPDCSAPIHTLKHVHFDVWEDFQVPSNKHLDDLINILDECALLLKD